MVNHIVHTLSIAGFVMSVGHLYLDRRKRRKEFDAIVNQDQRR